MSDEQRQIEMERGRHVAARAANLDKIERMEQSGRLKIISSRTPEFDPGPDEPRHQFLFEGTPIYLHKGPMSGPEWPPEALMAVLGLTVNALQLEVPPPRPTHHVSEESKKYNARMRETNKDRWEQNDGSKLRRHDDMTWYDELAASRLNSLRPTKKRAQVQP